MAHEIAHSYQTQALGYYGYWRLPVWKREGHADYVGQNEMFDYDPCIQQWRQNARLMDPARSGLYLRYEVMFYYLREIKGWGEMQILTQECDPHRLEQEILHQ